MLADLFQCKGNLYKQVRHPARQTSTALC